MGAYSDRVIADGASNYWRLGETAGTTAADLVGGKTGTISGGVTLGVTGALTDGTTGMSFNGTTGTILTAANVSMPLAVTIEGWITSPAPGGNFQCLCSSRNPVTTAGVILVALNPGGGRLVVYGTNDVATLTGVRVIADGQWHHVVALFNGTTVWLYVDGVLDNTGAFTRTALTGQPVSIGAEAGNFFWNGTLDEVALYPRALSATEIAAHYALARQSVSWPGVPWWVQVAGGDEALDSFNVWQPITTSDTVDLPRGVSGGIWVGAGGDVAAVMGNNTMPVVLAAVPTGAWLPIAARRINATGTTATGLVALYEI